MSLSIQGFCRGALIAGATLFATSAFAQMELKIIAPAAPGGGWDQTARSI
jgi:putative tricarboxylic transport membrane protein